ncbi:hypothetical protein [Shewanella woodyi]|uniref:Uncharacterized protein n=1 Tax=Shewanella woodyi (strain ATCC 51908 / MS32) TaxID=392500 RepID=B1KPC0_SHEWM|nr:hypothetical protein [Shewanella woodyi]ACA84690.1 conserved hypothetical protein [Shewanella woodyi ATCC 51908]
MKLSHTYLSGLAVLLSIIATPSQADTMQSRCDIYDKPQGELLTSTPCTFSQRQGYISINRDDGISYNLAPVDEAYIGTFEDQNGNWVYRKSGLSPDGVIFKMPTEYLYLYWGKGE